MGADDDAEVPPDAVEAVEQPAVGEDEETDANVSSGRSGGQQGGRKLDFGENVALKKKLLRYLDILFVNTPVVLQFWSNNSRNSHQELGFVEVIRTCSND